MSPGLAVASLRHLERSKDGGRVIVCSIKRDAMLSSWIVSSATEKINDPKDHSGDENDAAHDTASNGAS